MRKESKIACLLLAALWILPVAMNCGGDGGTSAEDPQDPIQVVLSGRITTPDGTPLPGIAVNLTGRGQAAGCSGYGYHSENTFTDSNGYYSFGGNVISGSATIRPSSLDFTFVPQYVHVSSSYPNPNMDFVAHLFYTLYPESVTNTSAILVGRANPFGQQTSVYFQWSADASFNTFYTTTSEDVGSDHQGHMVKHRIDGLTPDGTYYYRIVAQPSTGPATVENTVTFKTGTDPQISTGQAKQIKVHSAIMTGSFNPDGLLTSASFQWGINSNLSDAVSTPVLATDSSSTAIPFEYYLDYLSENSTFYYRAMAANSVTTKRGAVLSFTTLPLALPSGSTDSASYIKAESARISGTVNANGSSTSAWFEWGQDPVMSTYNTDGIREIGDGIEPENFYQDLHGLEQRTTYYYRIAASNEAGTWKGPILGFTTLVNPLVITYPATAVDHAGARLNGSVDNFGYDTTVWFLWGTDPSMARGVRTPMSLVPRGVGAQPFSNNLSGLAPSTRYNFRAEAMMSTGNGQGEILPFTTLPAAGASFWSRTYGGSGTEKATVIRNTADGGYGAAGWTTRSIGGIWTMKLTENGDIQWQKAYGSYLLDGVLDTLHETSDGGFILAGQIEHIGAGGSDYWILRLDKNGEILWQRTYGESGWDNVQAVKQTSDGGFMAAGYTNSFGAGDLDIWILKLDAGGVVQWQRALGTPSIDLAYSIENTDNGYVIGALSRSGLGVLLIKVGDDGTALWNRSYGSFEAKSITKTDDGGYILAGGKTLIKTDSEGILQWQKSLEGSGTFTYVTSVAPAGTTGCLLGGYTNSFNSEGPYDAFVVKLDGNGDIQWQKAYGGADDDRVTDVQETSDGSVIAAGFTKSFGVGDFDTWVLKLASDGTCPPLDRNIDFPVENITNVAVDAVLTVTSTDLLFQDTTAVANDIFFIPMQQTP